MPERVNAATELAREHAEIDRRAARVSELDPSAERAALVRELAELFLAHCDVEQRLLFPAVRRFAPGGWSVVADQARHQRAIARTVRAIEDLREPEGDAYDVLVSHLVVGIQDHVYRQDAVLLPSLIDACPIEDINRLGRRLSEGAERARVARCARRPSAGSRFEGAPSGSPRRHER